MNIKDLIEMCYSTGESVGEVTLRKELPESTLEVVHEMIRVLFYAEVNVCETAKVALTKEDLLKRDWWCRNPTDKHREILNSLGLQTYSNDWSTSNSLYFLVDSEGDIVRTNSLLFNSSTDKEITLNNGSFYYV